MRYNGIVVHTLTREDVGKSDIRIPDCPTCGHRRNLFLRDAIGRVQKQDVGKLVLDVGNGVLQVENNEQRDKRFAAATHT